VFEMAREKDAMPQVRYQVLHTLCDGSPKVRQARPISVHYLFVSANSYQFAQAVGTPPHCCFRSARLVRPKWWSCFSLCFGMMRTTRSAVVQGRPSQAMFVFQRRSVGIISMISDRSLYFS
jgi:hypothetical protein